MSKKTKSNTIYIVSWDCTGLEACINVTKAEKESLFKSLQGNTNEFTSFINKTVFYLLMRARGNPQRHYEIYTVEVDSSISENQFKKMFDECPQEMADLIREKGVKILSDRATTKPKII